MPPATAPRRHRGPSSARRGARRSRAVAAGATSSATTSRLPSPWTATTIASASSSSSAASTAAGRTPSARALGAVEADRQQPPVQQRRAAPGPQRRGRRRAARSPSVSAEHVAEQQAPGSRAASRARARAARRAPNSAVTTTATAVSRPSPGTRPTARRRAPRRRSRPRRRAAAARRPAPPARARGTARAPATRRRRRARRARPSSPSAPPASAEQHHLEQRARTQIACAHGSVSRRARMRARPSVGMVVVVGREQIRAPAARRAARRSRRRRCLERLAGRAPSSGGPNAIWRWFRHSTRSQARACSRSWVATSTPRPSAASSSSSAVEPLGARRVEAGERLVEQQQPRVLHERARDQHALALAAGQLAERSSARGRAARPRSSASSARRRSARPGRPPPRQPGQRPHQRDVERGDRVVEARALGLRHGGRARPRLERPRERRSSPSSTRNSVVLPPPLGPSTRDALAGARRSNVTPRDGRAAAVAGGQVAGATSARSSTPIPPIGSRARRR